MQRFWLLIFTLLLLMGCAHPVKRYRIGVSQCSEDIWRAKLNRELKAGEYFNDSIQLLFASANDDDRLQIAQIQDFINQGIDLLIVAPNQVKTISPAISEATAKGIPVILFDRKTNSNRYTAFIGCDNYRIGKTMGNYIANDLHGHGKVVEIRGLEGSSPAIERHKGFADALKGYPGIEIVASVAADWKEKGAYHAMQKVLQTHKDIDYVFGQNDRMALGARQAILQTLPIQQAKRVKYVGVDALATPNGGLELVQKGVLEASYLYPTKGDEVLALAMSVLKKQKYVRDNYLNSTIVTRDNAALMLMQAKDLERQNQNLDTLHRRVDVYWAQYNMQRWFTTALVIFLLLLIVTAAMLYRQYLIKTKLNEELSQSNEEMKRLGQEMREMTASQLAFFTNISHELRTPLTLILDPAKRLQNAIGVKPEHNNMIQLIYRNAQTLQKLVDTLLDFRKVQVGKMEMRLQRFDIKQALQQWTDNFALLAEQQQIDLQTDFKQLKDAIMVADLEKMQRIVDNLLSNAFKHTPAKGKITVSAHDNDNEKVVIQIADTGCGIEPELMSHIFDRFVQSKNAVGGTGIGLALVKAFTQLQGGEVRVESRLHQGSVFTVTLPRTSSHQTANVQQDTNLVTEKDLQQPRLHPDVIQRNNFLTEKEHETRLTADEERPKILVVDDNEDIRTYERSILATHYTVIEAVNGMQGLEMAMQEVPDLIVSDVMMPEMDGLEFCRKIKQNTATCHIPIILLTAKNLDEQRIEGYEQGADSYITKPFSHQLLLTRIRNLLEERAKLQAHYTACALNKMTAAQETFPDNTLTDEKNWAATSIANSQTTPAADKDQQFMDQLRQRIQQQMGNSNLNVEALGSEMGLSRVQLYRKVKALTGYSPVELLRKTRLNAAKNLLVSSEQSVSEIAYSVGFSSPSYFTKCFKEEYGIVPGDMQKRNNAS